MAVNEQDKKTHSYRIKTTIAGGLAGCIAKTALAPMDRIKILFQTSHQNYLKYQKQNFGFIRALRELFRTQGFFGLFKGHSATLLRIFPYAGIKFTMYEQFKTYIKPDNPKNQGRYTFLSASLAGVVAVAFTYPFEFLRIKSAYDHDKSLYKILKDVYFERRNNRVVGLLGFYKGILPTFIGIIPYSGVSFYSYESIKKRLRESGRFKNSSDSHNLNMLGTSLCGAASGILAQTCSYPIEIVRRNMQVGSGGNEFLNIITTSKQVYAARGMRGFFAGLGIGYLKVMPMFAISFYSYESILSKLI
jgi:solute carrier family 25 protein 16